MLEETVVNKKTGESCRVFKHSSGLTVYVSEKPDFASASVVYGTRFGSVNTSFKTPNGETITVPDGTAHFLEHKLFESEKGDAFTEYSQTGANANAYTSFDRTCYIFSCTSDFEKNLDILLGFVNDPYFTPETVQKEQGIIGQEIKMYDDSPSWAVLFDILKAMYHTHPVKIDIAGTVDSIAEITDKTLFECYNKFYNPSNMFLCVAGNVNAERIAAAVEAKLANKASREIEPFVLDEPTGIVKNFTKRKMAVSMPLFYLGIKDDDFENTPRFSAISEIVLNIICGKASPLYEKLLNEGLINSEFGFEHFHGPSYSALLFGGESTDPEKVKSALTTEINRIKNEGVDEKLFESVIRSLYGKAVRQFDSADDTVSMLTDSAVLNVGPFDFIDAYSEADIKSVEERIKAIDERNVVLSVIEPM